MTLVDEDTQRKVKYAQSKKEKALDLGIYVNKRLSEVNGQAERASAEMARRYW